MSLKEGYTIDLGHQLIQASSLLIIRSIFFYEKLITFGRQKLNNHLPHEPLSLNVVQK